MRRSKTVSAICSPAEPPPQEKLEQERIRNDLAAWARSVMERSGFEPAAHHLLLISELERLTRGEIDRLMVLMPPGSAKSTYASLIFPAWWFIKHPSSAVIAASHTADLALHFGRAVRNLITENESRLGYTLASDSRSAGRWHISTRGQYFATGIRGPVAGRRADLIIIDDPIKSQADADSAHQRDHVWNWYRADLSTRLKPGGRIILIMTRWHEDDLGGRLIASQAGEWCVLRLPAIAEQNDPLGRSPGTPLWPEWENAAALERKRRIVGEHNWSALFQQTPRPPGGSVFKIEHLQFAEAGTPHRNGRTVRAWDIAATGEVEGQNPDWTVGVKLQRTEADQYVVLDVVRLRGGVAEVNTALLRTARADGPEVAIGIPQDPGSAGKFMVRQITAHLAGYKVISSPEQGSKRLRAEVVAAQADGGNLAIVRAAWTPVFIEELRDFPYGRKDDQVDALSRAFTMLADTQEPARRMNLPLMVR